MKIISRFSLALLMGFASATSIADPTPAPQALSPAQKTQMEVVVHDYLVNHPEVLIEASDALQKQQNAKMEKAAMNALPGIASNLIFAKESPVMGNPNGTVTMVEFFDYQCPHCKDMQTAINAAIKSNPNLRVVLKELPIFGDSSNFASKAALAAQKQGKYQVFHDALFAQKGPFTDNKQILAIAKQAGLDVARLQKDMNSSEVQQEIKQSMQLASALNLSGTPAFVVLPTPAAATPNQLALSKVSFMPGQVPAAALTSAINKAK